MLNSTAAGSGPPLIILHGLFGSSGNWQSVARRLAGSFAVHALDLRNHGASPWFTDMSYPSMAADVHEYMRRGGLARAIVAGHSMGGKVAMELALSAPARVDALLVLDIAPSAYDRAHDHILEGMLSVDVRSLQTRDEADSRLADFIPEPRVRQFLLTNLRRRDGGGFEWRLNLQAIATAYDYLLAEVSHGRRSNIPALFLRGERSDHVGAEEERAIMEAFPLARIETVTGAGHWIGADAPDAVVDAAVRLGERVRRDPGGAPAADADGSSP